MKSLDSNILLPISVLLSALTTSVNAQTAITDANFKGACTAWVGGDTATYGDIANWVTTPVTDMFAALQNANPFNDDISGWDTSNVVNMDSVSNERAA
jgi:hypothetical protein